MKKKYEGESSTLELAENTGVHTAGHVARRVRFALENQLIVDGYAPGVGIITPAMLRDAYFCAADDTEDEPASEYGG
jgi:hypothetical protein